MLTQNNS